MPRRSKIKSSVIKNLQKRRVNRAQSTISKSKIKVKKPDLTDKLCTQLDLVKIKYKREYKFHKVRKWRIDLIIPPYPIAIECEGGQWVNGRHNNPIGFAKDMEKYNEIALHGYYLLRFNGDMIKKGTALQTIERLINLFS